MSLLKDIKRVEYVDFLIRSKKACSVDDLATTLKLSRRQVLYIIDTMRKDFKAPLNYSKYKKQYYFTDEKKFIYGYK